MRTVHAMRLWLLVGAALACASPAAAQDRGRFMLRAQLEPGYIQARQNGPLTMALDAFGLAGSVTVGMNIGKSAMLGVQGLFGLGLAGSLDVTPPAFDGAGDTVSFKKPSMAALLVGPHLTRVFEAQRFSVGVTAGAAIARFDYKDYKDCAEVGTDGECEAFTLPYNTERSIDPVTAANIVKHTDIPLDKTGLGVGLGIELAKLFPIRSEERRVGKECRRLCRSRWSPYH
jgi:hypothetical protein